MKGQFLQSNFQSGIQAANKDYLILWKKSGKEPVIFLSFVLHVKMKEEMIGFFMCMMLGHNKHFLIGGFLF